MKVSVVIPCYNVQDCIARCLNSIAAQTHRDLEIICVDDGSSDETAATIERYAAAHGLAIDLLRQPNQGACAARNNGMARATGTYIQFMDADDVLLPEKVAHQVALAETHGNPVFIVGGSVIRDPHGQVVRTTVQHADGRDPWLDLMAHRLSGTPTNLWRHDAVAAIGGWATGLASSQEYDLMFRLMKTGTMPVYDGAVLTEIHQRGMGSISGGDQGANWQRYVELRVRILSHLRTLLPADRMRPYLQVLFDSIRMWHRHDPAAATEAYSIHFPKGFRPDVSEVSGRGYVLLHRLLGFNGANRLRGWLRGSH